MLPTAAGAPIAGSYLTPSLEHGVVADAMHVGVHACDAGVTLRQVARLMATHHIHSIVVAWGDGRRWRLLTDLDVVRAAGEDPDTCTAGEIAGAQVPTIEPGAPLPAAARAMAEHGVSHLVVTEPNSPRPAGIVSSLDLAGIIAWGRA
jgi:CBS domain-containing protein